MLLDRFWEVLGYVFALNAEAFRIAVTVPFGLKFALLIVLLAGLSQGIGQSIILFINQVKPARFVFSLLINAVLFTFGFLALVLSTWLITLLPWSVHISFPALVTVLGLALAPLLFAFLGALPYLGVPILRVLGIWVCWPQWWGLVRSLTLIWQNPSVMLFLAGFYCRCSRIP
jgi:hypothetical protein